MVDFESTVDGDANLSVTGPVDFDAAVGGIQELSSLATGSGDTATLDASISTSGAQTYGGPVDLGGIGANVNIGGGADLTFASTINGADALSVGTTGTTDFEGAIGNATALTSLSSPSGGTIDLSGNVTTSGSQDYASPLELEAPVTFNSASNVTFFDSVSGHQLTMTGGGTMDLPYTGSTYGDTVVEGGSTLAFGTGALADTGTLTLNDGILSWGPYNPADDDVSGQLAIGPGGGTLDTNGNNVTFASSIAGSGNLLKTGSGTLTLNASGGYGRQLAVQGGSVTVPANVTVSTPITVGSGSSLSCDGGTLSGGVNNLGGTLSGAPDAPDSVTASPGYDAATVSFTPGTANCYPVSYTASTSGGLSWGPSASSPIALTGLAGNASYAFTVTEINPVGSASASSNTIVTEQPSPPVASISSPTNGTTYAQGQAVTASYTCQDGTGGTGIQSCTGPVTSGSAIDTSAPGQHTFTVTATSRDGFTASTTVTYTVASPAAPPNTSTIKSIKVGSTSAITVSLASLHGPGTVTATVRAPGVRAFSVRKSVGSGSTLKFVIQPSKSLKAKLKHKKLTAKLAITYTPKGGKPRTITKTVKLPRL